jgi:hypothetical protein
MTHKPGQHLYIILFIIQHFSMKVEQQLLTSPGIKQLKNYSLVWLILGKTIKHFVFDLRYLMYMH